MNELFNFIRGRFSDCMSLNGRAISEMEIGKNFKGSSLPGQKYGNH
jgi:hypothetical protein